MKRLVILFLFSLPLFAVGQNLEVGVMVGASGYQGDLSPDKSIFSTSSLHASFGFFGRLHQNRFLSYRLNFAYGTVSGDDANSVAENRRRRNLSFRSSILELGLLGEFNILGSDKRLSPYVFGGVALYHFNPQTEIQGRFVELQPLGTEGQGMPNFPNKYSKTQFAIPMGVGLKYAINDRFNVGLEFGLRKLFTDYLDDVSGSYVNFNELLVGNGSLAASLGDRTGEFLGTDPVQRTTGTTGRGNPDNKDWYFMSGVTLSYNLFNDNNWGGGKDNIGCPF